MYSVMGQKMVTKRFYFVTQVEMVLNMYCPDIFTYFLNESDASLCFAT